MLALLNPINNANLVNAVKNPSCRRTRALDTPGFLAFYRTPMLSSGFFMGTLVEPETQKVLFAPRNI
jgi:hypothetical protein